ncbi:hypothetical protein KFE98_17640 [bacterium SCSIO 12741]|nr:hypothetical protein KFE98_17640 [bacterium SCSIO 12741]
MDLEILTLESDEAGGSQVIEMDLRWNHTDYKYIQYNTFPEGHEGLTTTITNKCDDLYDDVSQDWEYVAVFYLDKDEDNAPHSRSKVVTMNDFYSLNPYPAGSEINGCYIVCNVDGTTIYEGRKTKGKVSNQGGGGGV